MSSASSFEAHWSNPPVLSHPFIIARPTLGLCSGVHFNYYDVSFPHMTSHAPFLCNSRGIAKTVLCSHWQAPISVQASRSCTLSP